MGLLVRQNKAGALFKPLAQRAGRASPASGRPPAASSERVISAPGGCALAFAGVYLFTLFLYARPGELFPEIFGALPIAKTIALSTPLIYFLSKLGRGERMMIWPLELKMAALIGFLGLLLAPIAVSRQDSFDLLFGVYLKLLITFALLINLTDTRERVRSLMVLILICCSWLAADTIRAFLAGDFYDKSGGVGRIEGVVGGLFSNPNDRATLFDMLLPLAVVLGLIRRGFWSLIYFALAALFAAGVIASFSRGGFLGLIATTGLLLWKFRRRNRLIPWVVGALLVAFLALAGSGSYGDRLMTIFSPNNDKTGSAQGRKMVLGRAVELATRHSLVGLGMGNFHIYSYRELRAHNAYLEIAAELGFVGLLAYLIMLFAPIRSLIRVERESFDRRQKSAREIYYLSIGLQGTFLAYLICSFFSSIQYDWYIYHPIVFAIALRRITQFEAQSVEESLDTGPAGETSPEQNRSRGALWRPPRVARIFKKRRIKPGGPKATTALGQRGDGG